MSLIMAALFCAVLPPMLKTTEGRVRLVFADVTGIEHPMCLSNRGRRAADGSYGLE